VEIRRAELYLLRTVLKYKGIYKYSRKSSKTQKLYGKTQKPTKIGWVFGFSTSPGPLATWLGDRNYKAIFPERRI
jgi:hypothetical protein